MRYWYPGPDRDVAAAALRIILRKRLVWMGRQRLEYGISLEKWQMAAPGAPTNQRIEQTREPPSIN